MAQRKEREMATSELGFKKQLTKEEKIEKKKERLAAIGIDFFYRAFCNVFVLLIYVILKIVAFIRQYMFSKLLDVFFK